MDIKKFIEPKQIEIDNQTFMISKIPAIQAQQIYKNIIQECREDGDIGMTYLSESATMSILSYCAAKAGEEWDALEEQNMINFYCKTVQTLIKLEAAMIRYNFAFLFDGTLQEVLGVLRDQQDM